MHCFNLITSCRVSIRKHGIWKKWTHPNSQLQRPGNFIQLCCACSWKKNQCLDPSASMFFRYEMRCRGPPVSCAVLTANPGQSCLRTSEIFIFPFNPQFWPMVLLEKYLLCFGNVHSLHMLMSYRVLSLSPFPPPNFPTLYLWLLFIWLSGLCLWEDMWYSAFPGTYFIYYNMLQLGSHFSANDRILFIYLFIVVR